MRRTVVGLVCIAVCIGLFQPALAEPTGEAGSSDPVAQLPPPPQVKNKLKTSCTTEKAMGSHIKRRTCRSQEELDQHRARSQAYMEEIRSRTSNSRGG